ncbi:MAG TPA: aminoacyl-tRNA hydrolase, partial [Candidatus Jacksonbacteria bacterium]|nr:aminoacyl-tRNA hydrolase [Candidatus Jacksonbacteria bacterium]
ELRKKFESEIVIIKNTIILAKPQTFMNNSGEAVLKIARFYKIKLDRIWIVYDDIDLQLGTLRIRKKGSSGGHNGVQSIIDKLGSREFQRFRLGVGPVPSEIDPADFVLSNFLKEEQKTADEMISSAALAITSALVEDTDDAEG